MGMCILVGMRMQTGEGPVNGWRGELIAGFCAGFPSNIGVSLTSCGTLQRIRPKCGCVGGISVRIFSAAWYASYLIGQTAAAGEMPGAWSWSVGFREFSGEGLGVG